MQTEINVVVVGYSTFSWELIEQLRDQIDGRLYFVLPDREQAMEAGLHEGVIAVQGDIIDTDVLDQLDLQHCHTFVASSRDDRSNLLSALYAKNHGARYVYARVFEKKFMPLLESVGITPLQTSHTAAAFMAVRILNPSVAELVSLTGGQFDLVELLAADYPDLIGCHLGHLNSDLLHIIAVAQDDDVCLGYNTVVKPQASLIMIYNTRVKKQLRQELHKLAVRAVQRLEAR